MPESTARHDVSHVLSDSMRHATQHNWQSPKLSYSEQLQPAGTSSLKTRKEATEEGNGDIYTHFLRWKVWEQAWVVHQQ